MVESIRAPLQQLSSQPLALHRPSLSRQIKPKSGAAKKSSTFRFFVVDNPAKLKDRDQMRANRKHVMNDYLDKERQNPSSTDTRVTRAGSGGRKRRQLKLTASRESINDSTPTNIFSQTRPANDLSFGTGYKSRSSTTGSGDLVASSIEQNDGYLTQEELESDV
jgi:hypothetical protein